MTEKDLLITPIWFILLSVGAYLIRPYVTDANTRRYFMPALLVRFVAAILLGVLYQFYYGGGDTFSYHTHGSLHIYEAFKDSFLKGIKLLFASGEYVPGVYSYASKIWFFTDPGSYFIVKVAALFDLLTFSTYSATALFFALFSFSGLWAFYQTFYKKFPGLHLTLAVAVLFFPSTVFWGSGLLKDTITIGALGWAIYLFSELFIKKSFTFLKLLFLMLNLYLLYQIKIYILLTLVPSILIWWLIHNIQIMRSLILQIIITPLFLIIGGVFIFYLIENLAATNPKYALDNIAQTAQITAYDIGFYTGRSAGSGYSIGTLDGTMTGMLELFPAAVNVTLFRPYLWEANNPLMILAAVESLVILVLTVLLLVRLFMSFDLKILFKSEVIFLLSFSIVFAFAVGASTFNFGTLTRYKIPLIPLYTTSLILIYYYIRKRTLDKYRKLPLQNTFFE